MMIEKNNLVVVTHSGNFHADDVFACATLLLVNKEKNVQIIRTRDNAEIANADIVVDVGKQYDSLRSRFDHHQTEGAGVRENGIPYASFGLVWKQYGKNLCSSDEVFEIIDTELACPIDAVDNGIDLRHSDKSIFPLTISSVVSTFTASWSEDSEQVNQENFLKMVEWAKDILTRKIFKVEATISARTKVIEVYQQATDKRIIVLDNTYPASEALRQFPEPLFVVKFIKDGKWAVKAINEEKESFINRKNLPTTWAGLDGEALQQVTGVKDAMFCHKNLFLAIAGSKEGALALANIAVES